MVNEFTPVPPVNTAPPVAPTYQSIVELVAGVAEIVEDPVEQIALPTAAVGADGKALIVAFIIVLVAEEQPVVGFLTVT